MKLLSICELRRQILLCLTCFCLAPGRDLHEATNHVHGHAIHTSHFSLSLLEPFVVDDICKIYNDMYVLSSPAIYCIDEKIV